MREQLITALSKIEEKLTQLNQQRNDEQFRCVVEELQHTLANATEFIPGPIHPATKFYKMRKNKNDETMNDLLTYRRNMNIKQILLENLNEQRKKERRSTNRT